MTVPARIAGLALLAVGAASVPGWAQGVDPAPLSPISSLSEPSFLLSVGWIAPSGEGGETLRVLGSSREGDIEDRSLTTFDRLFLPPTVDGRRLAPGDAVQLYRLGRDVVDPVDDALLGTVASPTGVAVVDRLAEGLAVAVIVEAFAPVGIGDRIRAVTETDTTWAPGAGPPGGAEGHVVAFQVGKAILAPYDVLFVRRTAGPPSVAGDRIELYRSPAGPRGDRLPDVRLGTAVVVRVRGDLAAAVLIRPLRSDLTPGDRFRGETKRVEAEGNGT